MNEAVRVQHWEVREDAEEQNVVEASGLVSRDNDQ